MNIYIYGSGNFKEEIHLILKNSNIKAKLDKSSSIQDLKSLTKLKNAIKNNPNDIYLIDEDKIFRNNMFNKKIKFFKAKDCIEEEYLLDYGIGDISINNTKDLVEHIVKKLDNSSNEQNIEESIIDIVNKAYKEKTVQEVQADDIEDEDLSKQLSKKEDKEDNNLDRINSNEANDIQGDSMTDEFSQFDSLNEDDVLSALANIDTNTNNSDTILDKKVSKSNTSNIVVAKNSDVSNVNDIAQLITQLLNNKTLEITIKVKT